MRHYKTLTWTDRLQIEAWLKTKTPVKEIARQLETTISTIYRELKRGEYFGLSTDWKLERRYSPERGEQWKQDRLRAKGGDLKIGNDIEYANFLEYMVCKEHYSPNAVLGKIKREDLKFNTTISKTTFYRYIDKGVFLTLTNKDLPVKGKKPEHKYKRVRAARHPAGTSIEKRPLTVMDRDDFGHWEMDCVEGKKGTKPTLLVLTERKTRYELIRLMPDKTVNSVVRALNGIERELGASDFRNIFKSITVDNGSEFADCERMEYSKNGKRRTKLYYCHPYSAFERGSNENQNKLVRRHYPKGFDFRQVTKAQVRKMERWINEYPREKFDFCSSSDLYEACLTSLYA